LEGHLPVVGSDITGDPVLDEVGEWFVMSAFNFSLRAIFYLLDRLTIDING